MMRESRVFVCSYPENMLPDAEDFEPKTMSIGFNNVFEVGCGTSVLLQFLQTPREAASAAQSNLSLFSVSQALKIGDNNVIESKGERLERVEE